MKHQNLDRKAKSIAYNYKRCEKELVAVISKVDTCKAFYAWGYSSLFSYLTDGLELSPAVSSNISTVVRKSHKVPQLKEKVLSGEISLGQARKIAPVITKDNSKTWLRLAQQKTQRQLEREVTLASSTTAVLEKSTYVAKHLEIKEKVTHKQ